VLLSAVLSVSGDMVKCSPCITCMSDLRGEGGKLLLLFILPCTLWAVLVCSCGKDQRDFIAVGRATASMSGVRYASCCREPLLGACRLSRGLLVNTWPQRDVYCSPLCCAALPCFLSRGAWDAACLLWGVALK